MANRNSIVEQLRDSAGLSKKEATEAFDAIFDQISQALANGDRVQIPGFGSFVVRHRKERAGRNPKTGEAMTIPASNVVGFKAGKQLRDAVNS